jgi:predicted metal-dependent phosphoesterase TrpH
MTSKRLIALGVFATILVAGSATDLPRVTSAPSATVLTADFHVHAAPGDGFLPVWEIQREAERRGLDVVAITNHNHDLATRLARLTGLVQPYPIVIDSQELTTPGFHMAAVGVSRMIDWRLSAIQAIDAIHAAGGIAIAAHPGDGSWQVKDENALRAIDGIEVAHPGMFIDAGAEREYRALFDRARTVNPSVAAIGSSDFHVGAVVAACRTYVFVQETSREAVLNAIRDGRTVATCPGGRVTGPEDLIQMAGDRLNPEQPMRFGYGLSTWIALTALIALGVVVLAR